MGKKIFMGKKISASQQQQRRNVGKTIKSKRPTTDMIATGHGDVCGTKYDLRFTGMM
jgi:hypothetical protein